MKLMIASDIHGSAYYCRAMLDAFQRESADRLLLLGDLLYHGPRNDLPREYNPKAVIPMLNEHAQQILCVRGNCDSDVDQMVLDFPIMAEYCILYAGKRMIFATHGHVFHQDNLPKLHAGDILLHGHTHVPACTELSQCLYLNPGSVSIPKNDSDHSYMILEDDCVTWKSLDGTPYRSVRLTDA